VFAEGLITSSFRGILRHGVKCAASCRSDLLMQPEAGPRRMAELRQKGKGKLLDEQMRCQQLGARMSESLCATGFLSVKDYVQ
jgi:hypothetical protein